MGRRSGSGRGRPPDKKSPSGEFPANLSRADPDAAAGRSPSSASIEIPAELLGVAHVRTDSITPAEIIDTTDLVEPSDVVESKDVAAKEDVDSIDSILRALYGSITFKRGEKPNWDRLRSLVLPNARFVHASPEGATSMSVEQFISSSTREIDRNEVVEFSEIEVARRTESFGVIAHAFSTFEARFSPTEPPFSRGINSIQLVLDRNRWWVAAMTWDEERPDAQIPSDYLISRS